MPSIISHPAVPLAIGLGLGADVVPQSLLIGGIVASVIPDIDVLSFSSRVQSGKAFAHRGLTHSFSFAAVLALLGALAFWGATGGFFNSFIFLFLSAGSHGILDAFTNGGSGVALLWPWSSERYFAPLRPILVSPISVPRFLSMRGVHVLISEATWVWMPCILLWLALAFFRPLGSPALAATTRAREFSAVDLAQRDPSVPSNQVALG
ncbi:MAG: metal-dependent hydrolase [Candidatus Binatia bacterium]